MDFVRDESPQLEMDIIDLLQNGKFSFSLMIKPIIYTLIMSYLIKKIITDNIFYHKPKTISNENNKLYNLQQIFKEIEKNTAQNIDQTLALKKGNIPSVCPMTGIAIVAEGIPSMTKPQLIDVIEKTEKSQKYWKKTTTIKDRVAVLQTIYDYLLANQEDIVKICSLDSGKLGIDASLGEILVSFEKLKWTINNAEKILKTSSASASSEHLFMKLYKGTKVQYEPLGLVSAVVSWNYPFHNLLNPIIPAIITGNGVIVKCSEQVIFSSSIFMKIFKEALIINGHDPDLINLFYCLPPSADDDVCDYFTKCSKFKHLTFIGSKQVASQILRNLSDVIIPNVMELGGKDCFVVLDSWSDIDMISSIIMRGTFQSSGQNCIGIERVIIQPKNYDALIEILHQRIKTMKIGSDLFASEAVDIGAMISDNRFDRLEYLVQDAVKNGARLLNGGKRYNHPDYPKGFYFEPTLLVDVNDKCLIAHEEVFGPILCCIKGDSNIQKLIKQANSDDFGLGSSIFGSDENTMKYIADNLETGNVALNDFATYYPSNLPFGGYPGKSGYGKFGGSDGLLGLTNQKSISYNKLSFFKTKIPGKIDYPIKNNRSAWWFIKNLNALSYAETNCQRIKAIFNLCRDKK
ncbi:hypothetical protein ACO0R3_001209 [Hanseniaspora guilliermondii]